MTNKNFTVEVSVLLNGNDVTLTVLGEVEAADRSVGLSEGFYVDSMHDVETGELVSYDLLSSSEQAAVNKAVGKALDRIERNRSY